MTRCAAIAVVVVLAVMLATATGSQAQQRPIDASTSTLTVRVYKSGLFSAFADNHVVRAPIARGMLDDRAVEIIVRAGELTVVDPDQSASTRSDIQRRMLGADVLDTDRFPEITFKSRTVEPDGTARWRVTGDLSLHGRVRPVSVSVAERDGRYLGSFALKQRDFGIEPISLAGGTVKVKDEVKIEFDISALPASRHPDRPEAENGENARRQQDAADRVHGTMSGVQAEPPCPEFVSGPSGSSGRRTRSRLPHQDRTRT